MKRSALVIVFLVVVIDLLGFGIVLPLLPLFGRDFVKELMPGSVVTRPDGKADLIGPAGALLGGLMAVFSLMQFLFAPVWGRVSDHVGRRPVLLVGLAGSVVFYALFGYASGLPNDQALMAIILLFVARAGAGVAGATISTAQAVIADSTTPEGRKSGMAIIGAAFGIGFTFGPALGAASLYFFPDNHGVIGYAAATLSLISLILAALRMPETRQFEAAPPIKKTWLDVAAFRDAAGNPALGPVMLAFFFATLGFASFEVTLALLNESLGLPKSWNLTVFTYVGLVLALTQGFLYRRLAKRLTEVAFMTLGILFMGLGVLALAGVTYAAVTELVGFAALLTAQLASLTLAVVGFAFLTPSAQALISRRADPARQGEVLGVNQSISAMARILGPVMGLSLYSATTTHMLPYAAGAALLLLMLPLMPVIRRHDAPRIPDVMGDAPRPPTSERISPPRDQIR
jgi:MFS family permease